VPVADVSPVATDDPVKRKATNSQGILGCTVTGKLDEYSQRVSMHVADVRHCEPLFVVLAEEADESKDLGGFRKAFIEATEEKGTCQRAISIGVRIGMSRTHG